METWFLSNYSFIDNTLLLQEKIIKLLAKYFGPHKVEGRLSKAFYQIKLPTKAKIHNFFLCIRPEKKVGSPIVSPILPSFAHSANVAIQELVPILEHQLLKRFKKLLFKRRFNGRILQKKRQPGTL